MRSYPEGHLRTEDQDEKEMFELKPVNARPEKKSMGKIHPLRKPVFTQNWYGQKWVKNQRSEVGAADPQRTVTAKGQGS